MVLYAGSSMCSWEIFPPDKKKGLDCALELSKFYLCIHACISECVDRCPGQCCSMCPGARFSSVCDTDERQETKVHCVYQRTSYLCPVAFYKAPVRLRAKKTVVSGWIVGALGAVQSQHTSEQVLVIPAQCK